MRTLFLVLTLLFSMDFVAANSNDQVCFSHGECQDLMGTRVGVRCLIVKTGTDPRGNITCTRRCYQLSLGSSCETIEGEQFGICMYEEYKMPSFDPSNPDCAEAVDNDLINL